MGIDTSRGRGRGRGRGRAVGASCCRDALGVMVCSDPASSSRSDSRYSGDLSTARGRSRGVVAGTMAGTAAGTVTGAVAKRSLGRGPNCLSLPGCGSCGGSGGKDVLGGGCDGGGNEGSAQTTPSSFDAVPTDVTVGVVVATCGSSGSTSAGQRVSAKSSIRRRRSFVSGLGRPSSLGLGRCAAPRFEGMFNGSTGKLGSGRCSITSLALVSVEVDEVVSLPTGAVVEYKVRKS